MAMTKGSQWKRVTGPNLHPENAERALKNKTVLESPEFVAACDAAGIKATKRQASRWNNKKGSAIKFK